MSPVFFSLSHQRPLSLLLMGIKGFSKWLRARYPASFAIPTLGGVSATYDAVYLDGNSLLHRMARISRTEGHLHAHTIRHLRELFSRHRPRALLMVVLDGPASLLKLPEQRRRRAEAALSAQRTGLFDAQQFTPGCLFMRRFEEIVRETITRLITREGHNSKEVRRPSPSLPLRLIISGAATTGEGEVKIFDQLRRDHRPSLLKAGPSHGIITGDSDALLQAIAYSIPRTFVLPPPWEGGVSSPLGTLNADSLRQCLLSEAVGPGRASSQVINDFALLVLLAGGDYLPALGWGNYARLWPLYCRMEGISLVDVSTGQIDLAALRELLRAHMRSPEFAPNQGLQRALLSRSQRDWAGVQRRIASYLASLQSLLPQVTGRHLVEREGRVHTNLLYSFPEAPSVGDLVELMDVATVSRLIEESSRTLGALGRGNTEIPYYPLPGAAAILMLSLRDPHSMSYLPVPLQDIANQFLRERAAGALQTDQEASQWLNERINRLDSQQMQPEEALSIFSQPASITRLARRVAITGNGGERSKGEIVYK